MPAAMPAWLPWVIALLAWALAKAIRLVFIEPGEIAYVCDPAPWRGWCAPRTALMLSFAWEQWGWLSLLLALWASGSRSRRVATVALALGAAGLVLYSYDPAAVGVLLAALVLVRRRSSP